MLLFADGFTQYGVTADLAKKWASNTGTGVTLGATAGYWGGPALQIGNVAGSILLAPPFNSSLAGYAGGTFNVAFWFKSTGLPSVSTAFLQAGTLGVLGYTASVGTNGQLSVINGSAGESSLVSAPNICDGQRHWIEWQTTISSAGGSASSKVAIDGTITANGSHGGATTGSPVQKMEIASAAMGQTFTIDSLIMWDDQAGLQTGELTTASWPIGPRRPRLLLPNGAGSNTNWALGAGSSNWQAVADAPYSDWDSTYVAASASGTRDSYAQSGFPTQDTMGSKPIFVVNVVGRNADAGSINAQGLVYSGGQFGLGDSKVLGPAYTTVQCPIYVDPATGIAWTNAGLNAAQIGVGV